MLNTNTKFIFVTCLLIATAGCSNLVDGNNFFNNPSRTIIDKGPLTGINPNAAPINASFIVASQNISESTTSVGVNVKLSQPSNVDVVVPLGLGGTAANVLDYSLLSNTIIIPAGAIQASTTVYIVNDSIVEPTETIVITMDEPTNAVKGAITQLTLNLLDNEGPLSVSFNSSNQTVSEAAGTVYVDVNLSSTSSQVITVPFTVSGTATGGSDFNIASTSVSIPAGYLSATIPIQIINDAAVESNETIVLTMGNPTNAAKGAINVSTVTINDNDLPSTPSMPSASFSPASQSVSESIGTASVTVNLSSTYSQAVTVPWTLSGSASGGVDYNISTSSVTIAAGQTSATIPIYITDDSSAESDETIVLTMGNPTNATKGGTTVSTTTITDNDSSSTMPTIGLTTPTVGTTNYVPNGTLASADIDYGFIEYLPAGYDQASAGTYPLVIFLHGVGERGNGDIGSLQSYRYNTGSAIALQYRIDHGTYYNAVVISPQCTPEVTNWQVPRVEKLVNWAIGHYKIDPKRVLVTGLSMGGGGTWDYVIYNTNKIAAVVPVCTSDNCSVGDAGMLVDSGGNLKTKVWGFHALDDGTVGVGNSYQCMNEIGTALSQSTTFESRYVKEVSDTQTGHLNSSTRAWDFESEMDCADPSGNPWSIPVCQTIFRYGGHGIWDRVYKDSDAAMTWLLQQSKP